jgi:hypothetical protein
MHINVTGIAGSLTYPQKLSGNMKSNFTGKMHVNVARFSYEIDGEIQVTIAENSSITWFPHS